MRERHDCEQKSKDAERKEEEREKETEEQWKQRKAKDAESHKMQAILSKQVLESRENKEEGAEQNVAENDRMQIDFSKGAIENREENPNELPLVSSQCDNDSSHTDKNLQLIMSLQKKVKSLEDENSNLHLRENQLVNELEERRRDYLQEECSQMEKHDEVRSAMMERCSTEC